MNDNVDNMRDTISSGVGDMANAAKDGMDNLGNLAKEKILDQNGGLGITTTVGVSYFIFLWLFFIILYYLHL